MTDGKGEEGEKATRSERCWLAGVGVGWQVSDGGREEGGGGGRQEVSGVGWQVSDGGREEGGGGVIKK